MFFYYKDLSCYKTKEFLSVEKAFNKKLDLYLESDSLESLKEGDTMVLFILSFFKTKDEDYIQRQLSILLNK
jgi:predicted DNA-binding protein